jgi:hypothetical protein
MYSVKWKVPTRNRGDAMHRYRDYYYRTHTEWSLFFKAQSVYRPGVETIMTFEYTLYTWCILYIIYAVFRAACIVFVPHERVQFIFQYGWVKF